MREIYLTYLNRTDVAGTSTCSGAGSAAGSTWPGWHLLSTDLGHGWGWHLNTMARVEAVWGCEAGLSSL